MSYEDSIYGDSQTDQPLRSILSTPGNVGPLPKIVADHGEECHREDNSMSPAPGTSVRSSIPPIHFHGLANTQTQSNRNDALVREGSLKENTDVSQAGSDDFPGLKFTSASALHMSSHALVSSEVSGSGQPSSNEWNYRSRTITPPGDDNSEVSVRPIRIPSTPSFFPADASEDSYDSLPTPLNDAPPGMLRKSMPTKRPLLRTRTQEPRSGSQDSFAGELPHEIQQKLRMQSSKAFNAPLSAVESQQSVVESQDVTSQPSAYRPTDVFAFSRPAESQESVVGDQDVTSQPSAYRPAGVSALSHPGESQELVDGIDVDSQPSAYRATTMELSRPQPQLDVEDSREHDFAQIISESQSSHGFMRRSSQVRSRSLGQDASMELGSESTQSSISFQPTQTSEQDVDQPTWNTRGQSAVTTSTTNPRSLLSMVHPKNRWRYATYGESPQSPLSPKMPAMSDADTQANDTVSEPEMLETQPSDASNIEAAGMSLEQSAPPSPPPVAHGITSKLTRIESSDMDVVPDSEATQVETQPPEMSPEIPLPPDLSTSNDTPQRGQLPTVRELSADEVVPDSYAEDDDDEEDVPLASLVVQNQVSGGSKLGGAYASKTPSKSSLITTSGEVTPVVGSSKGAQDRRPASNRNTRQKEVAEVASSPYENDLSSTRKKSDAAGASSKGKKGSAAPISTTTPIRTRSLRSSSAIAARKNYYESSDDGDVQDSDGDGPAPSVSDDVDERTEHLEENVMEVEESRTPVARPNKRKRAASVASTKLPKPKSKGMKKPSSTPESRPAKRRKSGSPSEDGIATRVFALWKQDNHFYSGVVCSLSHTGHYNIDFDDDTKDVVDITNIRKCELKKGDDVLLVEGDVRAVIVGISHFVTHGVVTVEVDAKPRRKLDVPSKGIKIACRTVMNDWMDRTINESDIITLEGAASSSGSSSVKKFFHKTAFVLTFPPGFQNADAEKGSLTSSIRKHGGTVLEDWMSLFTLDGHSTLLGKRWEASKQDVKLRGKWKDLKRVFLLSNETSNKPRYLIALALGVPCLNVQWLHDSVDANEERNWRNYLLPAGTSERLSARVSQLVDLDWCNSPHHLRSIMDNLVAAKPFAGKTILCISPDFVPRKSNSGDNAQQMVPRILLCMGAAHVEAVSDPKNASHKLADYDLVVLKDEEINQRNTNSLKGATCVHMGWVKDCLFTSRLLPLPPK